MVIFFSTLQKLRKNTINEYWLNAGLELLYQAIKQIQNNYPIGIKNALIRYILKAKIN